MKHEMTVDQAATLMVGFLSSRCAPGFADEIAGDIGYRTRSLFDTRKRRAELIAETACLYAALVISAANQSLNKLVLKSVVDAFLRKATSSIFRPIEQQVPGFSGRYTARLENYFPTLAGQRNFAEVAFTFMQHLGLQPLKNVTGQLKLAARIGEDLQESVRIIGKFEITGSHKNHEPASSEKEAFAAFLARTESWDGPSRVLALTIIGAALGGKGDAAAKMLPDLTVAQADELMSFLASLGVA